MKNLLKNLWSVLTSPFVGLYHLLFGSKQDDMFIAEFFEGVENDLAIHNKKEEELKEDMYVADFFEGIESEYDLAIHNQARQTKIDESAVTSDAIMSFVGTLGLFAAASMYNVLSSAADHTGQCPANHTLIGTY